MLHVVITGGSSGLGAAIKSAMASYASKITDWSLATGVDLSCQHDINDAASRIDSQVDILINCAGVNEINWLPDLEERTWNYIMDVNARAIFFTTQALLEKLRGGTVLNIVSNASHVPMTCSLVYNASKGAAAIMTRQLARELGKTHNITVFAISPNKLAGTSMSKYIDMRVQQTRQWTEQQARAYQLQALPAGEETDPDTLAEFIAFLLEHKRRHKYLAGCDIPYGA